MSDAAAAAQNGSNLPWRKEIRDAYQGADRRRRTGVLAEVLERRAQSVNVVLLPTLVQGERAGEQIVAAIGLANEFNTNVV